MRKLLPILILIMLLFCWTPQAHSYGIEYVMGYRMDRAPTTIDTGFPTGTLWIDTTNKIAYVRTDNQSTSSATWEQIDGGVIEDETYNSTNFNGDTTKGVSQDDFYDYNHTGDTDDDGLVDKVDLSSAGLMKVSALGAIAVAVANTDYEPALTDEASLYATLSDVSDFVQPSECPLDSDFSGNGLMERTGAGAYGIATEGTDYLAPSRIDDTKGNGDTGYVWSADKVFDQLAGKEPTLTDKASLEGTISDVSDFAEANGDTYSGAHDFGGAASLEIPNSANPTTDAAGEIPVDTDDEFIEFYGAASRVIPALQIETVCLAEPDQLQAEQDDWLLWHCMAEFAPHGVTIVDIALSSPDAYTDTIVLEAWSDAVGTTQTTIESIAATGVTRQEDDGSLSSSALGADEYLNVNLDDATDNISELCITWTYRVNPGD